MEEPITIVYGIKTLCGGPFQVWQLNSLKWHNWTRCSIYGLQQWVLTNTCDGDCDNWKSYIIYDEMKTNDRCTFSGGWMWNVTKLAAKGDKHMDYSCD